MTTSSKRTRLGLAAVAVAILLAVLAIVLSRPGKGPVAQEPGPTAPHAGGDAGSTSPRNRPVLTPVKGTGAHSLTGWVRGGDGGNVAGAQVTATLELGPGVDGIVPSGPNAKVVMAISESDGAFHLEGLDPGRYRLRIEREGLVTAELRFVDAPGDGLVILVSHEVSVVGKVVAATGDVAAVRVFLKSESANQSREQNASKDGTFAFTGLAEGRYRVWAQGPGQASPSQEIHRLGAQAFDDVNITMQEAFAVTGRVVEANSSGLGMSANIVVRSARGIESPRHALALADGSFAVAGLLPGRWIAEAGAPGYVPSDGQGFLAESNTALLLTLGTGGEVSGVVRSASGGPLAGASVQLVGTGEDGAERRYSPAQAAPQVSGTLAPGQRFIERGELGVLLGPIPLVPPPGAYVSRVASIVPSGDETQATEIAVGKPSQFVTDSLGRFHVSGLDAGRYRIHASHSDFADAVSKAVVVRPDGKPIERTITLRSGTKLTGLVLTDKGVAIAGASIFARFVDNREQAMAVTNSDGRFVFAPMSGALDLVVEAVGYGRSKRRHTLSAGGLVAASKNLEVRLTRADAVLEGRLVDNAGFAIRDAMVSVVESAKGLPVRPARTDADGLFRIDGLLPGKQWVQVAHSEYPPLKLQTSTGDDIEITVPLGAALALSIRDQRSEAPIPMADVVLIRIKDGVVIRGISDMKGRAKFAALVAGEYSVTVSLKGYARTRQSVRLAARSLRADPDHEEVVEMSKGSTLAGILLDGDGDRVEGATLSVGLSRATSDREGRFRLEDVIAGDVTLAIEKDGAVATQKLQVEVGEERVTLELRYLPEEAETDEGDDDSDDDSTDGEIDADDADIADDEAEPSGVDHQE